MAARKVCTTKWSLVCVPESVKKQVFRGLLKEYGKFGLKYVCFASVVTVKSVRVARAKTAAWRKLQERVYHRRRRESGGNAQVRGEGDRDARGRWCLVAVRSPGQFFLLSCATGLEHLGCVRRVYRGGQPRGYMMIHWQPSFAWGAYGSSALDTVPQTDGIR